MKKLTVLLFMTIILSGSIFAQKTKTDAIIVGHVTSEGEHLAYITISLKGTTVGTATDETGHFQIINAPIGEYVIVASGVGYKTKEYPVVTKANSTTEIKFELEQDVLGLEGIVISADRNEKSRANAPVIINTLNQKLFSSVQANSISEGLSFCSGLRIENDCQNCGMTQLRMNGMEGAYSQVLINNRPIFSGLVGIYGLELIPSNMIERIEVVRGGGSALYGSNAIAGTINLILKDPVSNTLEAETSRSLIGLGQQNRGDYGNDQLVKFNASIVTDDKNTGLAAYGYFRNRTPFDANGDEYSELTSIENSTIGARFFHRFGYRSKLSIDFFNIKEDRRGGNKFDSPEHEADIAESVNHNITTGGITYEQFFREYDLLSVYASGQFVDRDSYYGALQSLSDYGHTEGATYIIGTQYKATFKNSNLVVGGEYLGDQLVDNKLGYPDYSNPIITDGEITGFNNIGNTLIAYQQTGTLGLFSQYDLTIGAFQFSLGGRFDNYKITDLKEDEVDGASVFSPRISILAQILPKLQGRVSYSQGYRAPQIYDEDLHIETSGSRKVIHQNAPDLTQETSHSIMASLDLNGTIGSASYSFLTEGFYTRLDNPFANSYSTPDETGTVIYTRVNAEHGATVQGINLDLTLIPSDKINIQSGFTLQNSKYDEAQEFESTSFFRTPNTYGYINTDYTLFLRYKFSVSGNYTGKMLIPYFGTQLPDGVNGELRETNPFLDMGAKFGYTTKLGGVMLEFYTGIKNIFNAYQKDFDFGVDRDPTYIYGPMSPRTIYAGIRMGNFLK
jgi:outer membrane receptor for ferrienterochelin and colicins